MQGEPDDIPVNSSTAVGHQQQPNHYLPSSSNSFTKAELYKEIMLSRISTTYVDKIKMPHQRTNV